MILQILYTCEPCGLFDVKLTVPHRKQGEDIVPWVKDLTRRISDDHRARSPQCMVDKMTSVKIPIPSDGLGIGYARPVVENNSEDVKP